MEDSIVPVVRRETLSSLTHFLGACLSVAVLVLLIIVAVKEGTARHIVGFSLFGTSLILLYSASAIYHFIKNSTAKKIFLKVDQSMIYVLIAGTYTAVALSLPSQGWGWSLFGIEWGLALIGVVIQFFNFKFRKYLTQVLYLGMGWLAVIALPPLLSFLPKPGLVLLVAGGLFYTVGFVFFVLDRLYPWRSWFTIHDIFHFFVLAGSASHVWLMFAYVV